MIKSLYGDTFVCTTNPTPIYGPSGIVRWNSSMSRFEIDTGSDTTPLEFGTGNVGLNSYAQTILNWAAQKMQEEAKLKEIMEKHPMIRDLQSKLDMMIALVKEYE